MGEGLIGDEQLAGVAECLACGTEWLAVWPTGAAALHCPDCESVDTVREAHMTVETAVPRRTH